MKKIISPEQLRTHLAQGLSCESEYYATANISWRELLTKQTDTPPLLVLQNLLKVAQVLQKYRDTIFKKNPIIITSGWRSPAYNKKIGGASKSQHTEGKAIDFVVANHTPRQAQQLLDKVHQGGLEYAPSWIHVDIRNVNVRFDPNGKVYQIGEFFK